MKTQLLNIKAAIFYLAIFQNDEFLESIKDEFLANAQREATQQENETMKAWLTQNHYPSEPLYDNEGIPIITWPDNFNCQEFYEMINYDAHYLTPGYTPQDQE
jgi:hypothetical protein